MIVKDEPVDRLAMLIDYLRPALSQFVIVDTTLPRENLDVPLYESWGVIVDRIHWPNDFSAARNYTLQYLTTDWVLHLDADELPSRAMMEHIEWAKENSEPKTYGWLYFTRNYWGGERGIEVPSHWHCRLFRREKGMWYRKLHEGVRLDGREEPATRDTITLKEAPKDAYLIHSKPREMIEKSAALYAEMEKG